MLHETKPVDQNQFSRKGIEQIYFAVDVNKFNHFKMIKERNLA